MTALRPARPSRLFVIGRLVLAAVVARARRNDVEGDLAELWQLRADEGRRDLRRAYLRDLAGIVAARIRPARAPNRRHRDDAVTGRWTRGGHAMWLDVRYAFRLFRREPVFTGAALLTLTLGIAASLAIFTTVDRLLLRPLPYPDPARLVTLEGAPTGYVNEPPVGISVRDLPVLSAIGVYASGGANLDGAGEAVRLTVGIADRGFFEAMAVAPLVGRPLPPIDVDGYPRFAVLGYDLWRARFAADRGVPGSTISLNGQRYVITGVMPPGFVFPGRTEVWVPPGADFQVTGSVYAPTVVARLAPGVTLAHADDALATLNRERLAAVSDRQRITLVPLAAELTSRVRPVLLFLTLSVVLLLLVVCTNVANLLLARVSRRTREFAVRRALGGSRWRLARQLLIEGVLLSGVAAIGGAAAAGGVLRSLRALVPDDLGLRDFGAVDPRVLLAAVGVSVLATMVFGIAPALAAASQPAGAVVRAARDETGSRRWRRLRSALIVTQMAAALLLLTASAAAIGTLLDLARVDLGFASGRALTMTVTVPQARYATPTALGDFVERALDRLASAPGVRRVGATGVLPGSREFTYGLSVSVDGRPAPADAPPYYATMLSASPEYFRAIGASMIAGRSFTAADRRGAPSVVILSESAARALFPDGSRAVGRRVLIGRPGPSGLRPYDVVGVVGDIHLRGPEGGTRQLHQAYTSMLQIPPYGNLSFVAELEGDPAAGAERLRAAFADVDPTIPIYDVQTLDSIASRFLASHRLALTLVGGFAGITVLVAAIGLYGLVAQTVSQRAREIGVRIALGAEPRLVRRRVLIEGASHALAGAAVGTGAALVGLQGLAANIPGLASVAPGTLAVNAAVLVGVACAAAWLPALRASRINPVEAMRE